MLTFRCPACQRLLSLAAELAGRKFRCPCCRQICAAPTTRDGEAVVVEVAAPVVNGSPAPGSGVSVVLAHSPDPDPGAPLLSHDSEDSHRTLDFFPSRSDPENDAQENVEGAEGVPGYEIVRELGRGGMGVVYQARQTRLNRVVALKMILAGGHAEQDVLARFQREAEALARLQHPNIVQVFEVSEHNGLPFFSLEFCPGGSLEKQLDGTPLPPREAAVLVQTLARAMHAAHQADVIHRDLKPANVLLTADGMPKITDFGLAKLLDEAGQTQTGAALGTPSYMAPEQAEGKKEVGPATDIYALGAILYECLTGRPPFKAATTLDTLMQVVADEPVPPRRLNPQVPADLETICLKCLHKEPGKRYASADELADDLGRFVLGEPVQARPLGRWQRGAKWVRRNPFVVVALLVTGVFWGLSVVWALLSVSASFRGGASNPMQSSGLSLAFEKVRSLEADLKLTRDHLSRSNATTVGLAGSLAAASSRLGPKEAAPAAATLQRAQARATDPWLAQTLARCFQRVLSDPSPEARRERALALCSGVGCVPGCRSPLELLPFLRLAGDPPGCRLSSQQLANLLQDPGGGEGPRRVILDHLGRRYQRRFEDAREFIRFAREQKLPIDFASPPQRPAPASAGKP